MFPWCASMGVGSTIATLLVWVAVMALAVWAIGRLFPVSPPRDARALLDERLASGELDADAYHALQANLDDGRSTTPSEGLR